MSEIKVKFLEAGRWGDNPADPLFDVVEGEERLVSAGLANAAIIAGKAVFMPPEEDVQTAVAPEDDAPTAGPVKKAEGKSVKKKAEDK